MTVFAAENRAELWLLSPGFDDLNLVGTTIDSDGSTFHIGASDEANTWGSPQPVDVAVQRWMADGAVAVTQGHDDRTITMTLVVEASTSVELAAGETALVKRAATNCLLKFVPPQGDPDAPATVFEVYTWHLEHIYDGPTERILKRGYTATFTAKPWARSDQSTSVAALPAVATPNTVEVDACTSVTHWSSPSGGGVATSGGAVKASLAISPLPWSSQYTLELDRTATISMGSTPFVVTDVTLTPGGAALQVQADGVTLTKVASLASTSWWSLPPGVTSVSVLAFVATWTVPPHAQPTLTLAVNDVSRSDSPGGVGTHRQLFRSLDVGGSVSTTGSVQVASPSATGLGNVLVYTCPDAGSGYVPAMRRYRVSGNDDTLTLDATTCSGAYERLERTGLSGSVPAATVYTIPPGQILEATYAIVARMKCAAAVTEPFFVSTNMVGSSGTGSVNVDVPFDAANTYQFCFLGLFTLPPSPVPSESQASLSVSLLANVLDASYTAHAITLDELYLFDVTHGSQPTVVAAGSKTRLWLDAPDVDTVRNRPAIYLGTKSDRSDAFGAISTQIKSMGFHELDPDGALVFTVTDGVLDATASASFYQRWHTHAGA